MRQALILVLVFSTFCGCSKPKPPPIVSFHFVHEVFGNETSDVAGTLKNESPETLHKVTVSYAFYDNGQKVDDASDEIQTLAPGESWAFNVNTLKAATDCKLEDVTSAMRPVDVRLQ